MNKAVVGNVLFTVGAVISIGFVVLADPPSGHGVAVGLFAALLGAPFWIPGMNMGSWFN